MATRVYPDVISNTYPVTPSSWLPGWNVSSGGASWNAFLSPSASTSGTLSFNRTGTGVSGQTKTQDRFIIGPLMAQTISGTVKGQMLFAETNASDNYTSALGIKIIKPTGDDRGVLLAVSASDDTSATPPELAVTTHTNRKFRDSSENTSLTLAPVTCDTGDYLVIEVGFRQASTSVANCAIRFGISASQSDLPEDDSTTTTTTNPWFEFSQDIAFAPIYFGSSTPNPADNGTANEPTTLALTPPTGMVEGDLVVMMGQQQNAATGNCTLSADGGQSWSTVAEQTGNDQTFTRTWTQFAGSTDSAQFDGTNDYMTRGATLTGAADSKSGIFSCWVRKDGTGGGRFIVGVTSVGGSTERFSIAFNATTFAVILNGWNAAGTQILAVNSGSVGIDPGTGWHHVLISWDLNTAGARAIYIDDVDVTNEVTFTNDTIDYTVADWGVGAAPIGTPKITATLAELYFRPGSYLDLSVEANRRKFIKRSQVDGRWQAVYLGATGQLPTGASALVYQHIADGEAVANFATNRGTGGNFTITGTLTLVSDEPPSDAYWTANPSLAFAAIGGTVATTAVMHVFRGPPGTRWEVCQAFAGATEASAATVTITGITPDCESAGVITLAGWAVPNVSTWGTLAGSGWQNIGSAQYRNTAGTDQSSTYAYQPLAAKHADAADFDGTNDYMTRGAGLTGAADSRLGLFSCWLRLDGGNGSLQKLLHNYTGFSTVFEIERTAGNKLRIHGTDNVGTERLDISSTVDLLADGNFVHILASWDLNTAGNRRIYINDVDVTSETTFSNGALELTGADWFVAAQGNTGTNKLNGAIAEFYFGTPAAYFDLSVESNRRKFITARKQPVFLGATGAGPTGTAPLIYLSNSGGAAVANFATNKGSGGNFSITGRLEPLYGAIYAGAADFDGTNDYMTRGADLSSNADSKSGIFSCWVYGNSFPGLPRILAGVTTVGGATPKFVVGITGSDDVLVQASNAAAAVVYNHASGIVLTAGRWNHILVSWDLNSAGSGRMYINDVLATSPSTFTNDTIDYTVADWSVGAYADGTSKHDGMLAELYFAPGQYLDLSDVANRRKFITAQGTPVNLLTDGSGPTGTIPKIFFHLASGEGVGNFSLNRGSGGDFTITGALTEANLGMPQVSWNTFGAQFTNDVSKNPSSATAGISFIEAFKAVWTGTPKLLTYSDAVARSSRW